MTRNQVDLAVEVSRQVNAGIRRSPIRGNGTAEYWSLSSVCGGDCEDFVLLKKRVLIARKPPAARLLFAAVLDDSRRSHAVLVLRTDDLVLDTLTDRVLGWRETGYAFVRMQAAGPRPMGVVLTGSFLST